ncbi:hypothetical protein RB195_002801 [Necator americanus]|uniref:Uncharacterized protein n=1 Tax=Necator americanus TaxID=51031 RepID=A0ABR1DKR4_NECAM
MFAERLVQSVHQDHYTRISRTPDEAQPRKQVGFHQEFTFMDHIQTVSRVIEALVDEGTYNTVADTISSLDNIYLLCGCTVRGIKHHHGDNYVYANRNSFHRHSDHQHLLYSTILRSVQTMSTMPPEAD